MRAVALALPGLLLCCATAHADVLRATASDCLQAANGNCLQVTAGPLSPGPNNGQVWPPNTIAYIPCGASVSAFVSAGDTLEAEPSGGALQATIAGDALQAAQGGPYGSGNGVLFQLAGSRDAQCSYVGQSWTPQNSETISGDCSSPIGRNTLVSAQQSYGLGADPSNDILLECVIVVDAHSDYWQIIGGKIYKDGVPDTTTTGVTFLLFYTSNIYRYIGGTGQWAELTGTSWPTGWATIGSDPR